MFHMKQLLSNSKPHQGCLETQRTNLLRYCDVIFLQHIELSIKGLKLLLQLWYLTLQLIQQAQGVTQVVQGVWGLTQSTWTGGWGGRGEEGGRGEGGQGGGGGTGEQVDRGSRWGDGGRWRDGGTGGRGEQVEGWGNRWMYIIACPSPPLPPSLPLLAVLKEGVHVTQLSAGHLQEETVEPLLPLSAVR